MCYTTHSLPHAGDHPKWNSGGSATKFGTMGLNREWTGSPLTGSGFTGEYTAVLLLPQSRLTVLLYSGFTIGRWPRVCVALDMT